MKYILYVVLTLGFSGCVTQKEEAPKAFPWFNSDGDLASEDEVASIQKQCNKKIEGTTSNENLNEFMHPVRGDIKIALKCASDLGFTIKDEE